MLTKKWRRDEGRRKNGNKKMSTKKKYSRKYAEKKGGKCRRENIDDNIKSQ